MKILNKKVLNAVRLILLNMAVISLLFIALNLSLLIYPEENARTRDSRIAFEWIGMNNAKLDENPQFTSPVEIANPVMPESSESICLTEEENDKLKNKNKKANAEKITAFFIFIHL